MLGYLRDWNYKAQRWVTNKLDKNMISILSLFSSHKILTRLTTKPRTETTSSLSCFTSGGSTSLSTA